MPFLRRSDADRSRSLQPLGSTEPKPQVLTNSALDQAASVEDVRRLFQAFLQEQVGDTNFLRTKVQAGVTVMAIVEELLHSSEFWTRFYNAKVMRGGEFRIPQKWAQPVLKPKEVLLIGSCAADVFYEQIAARERATKFNKITFNNGSVLPLLSDNVAADVDFQMVQLPIRAIMPEHMYLNGELNETQAKAWFEVSRSLLKLNLEAAIAYHRKYHIQTFVLNFMTPQQNPIGRLQNPYRFINPVYYVAELNRELYSLISDLRNIYYIDVDQISGDLGKRFTQDDSVSHINHGSTLSAIKTADDEARIETVGDPAQLYSERVLDFNSAIYDEVLAAYRSIKQHRAIKLVIFDLDDTLWRGVAAERLDDLDIAMTEGWPLGIVEAASFLVKRGVIVSIVSKNDEKNVIQAWNALYESRFSLENFVGRQINWDPKIGNIKRILELVNVGADATLFVDDNPAERSRIQEGIPGIRLLDGPVADWRRHLLWSAELQPPVLTEESLARASTIRAKEIRDDRSLTLSRDEFLGELNLKIALALISSRHEPKFSRCIELINKTNQFNTTGRRWTELELEQLFDKGGRLLAFSVQDRHASYGITALAICEGAEILQYVMSCRVFGLGVEESAISLACTQIRKKGASDICGLTATTDRNHLSLDVFARCGFLERGDGLWLLPLQVNPSIPAHVNVVDIAE